MLCCLGCMINIKNIKKSMAIRKSSLSKYQRMNNGQKKTKNFYVNMLFKRERARRSLSLKDKHDHLRVFYIIILIIEKKTILLSLIPLRFKCTNEHAPLIVEQ